MKKQKLKKRGFSSTSVSLEQTTISRAFERARKYERGGKNWNELTDAVTFCLAKDMMPLYSVEKEGYSKDSIPSTTCQDANTDIPIYRDI